MARRRGNRCQVDDSDDDNETLSTISSFGTSSIYSVDAEEDVFEKENSQLDGFIDALYEKRGSTREAGLRGLISVFTSSLMLEFVRDKYETLVSRFVASIKKSGASSSEVALACRALGLLAVTVAGDVDLGLKPLVGESFGPLLKLVKGNSDSGSRLAALECLAIVSFVGMLSGDVDVESTTPCGSAAVIEGGLVNLFWQISSGKGSGAVRAVAVTGWSLLFTALPSYRVAHHVQVGLPGLCDVLIHAEDLGLRKAAGEAVGLLFQAAELPEDVGDDLEEVDEAGNGSHGPEVSSLVQQMKAVMVKEAAAEGKSRQSRKERSSKINTSSFRAFLASIEDGCQCRETLVKLQHGDILRIDTWMETIQMNYMRKFLAEGFQKHMQDNTLFHHVFHFVPRESAVKGGTKRERNLQNAASSKARTQEMNRRRSAKDGYLAG
eukprot:TRINITY_DN18902_c0_g1_i1.p1 TRINITY_DN18902_c0_g1~~TRINITY_DN18902_c0_g1_i1.p1  ORF type:complete len:437 (+),score=80.31 TRINITY_DN18902_c0_g1_i1:254-1564(+)